MNQSPQVSSSITVRNLPPSEETRSTVAIKVERLVNEYITIAPNSEPSFHSSYYSCPPYFFDFDITSDTRPSQILQILRTQLELSPELNLSLILDIFLRVIHNWGRTNILMNVLVQISYDVVLDIGFVEVLSSVEEEEASEDDDDFVETLVRYCVIGEELGLENQTCAICLENLLENSEKIPTRMACLHLFHNKCIAQWLYRKNSCPLCRKELY